MSGMRTVVCMVVKNVELPFFNGDDIIGWQLGQIEVQDISED